MSAEPEQLEVLMPCEGGGWGFDLYEELEDLRDQVAFLRAQLSGSDKHPLRAHREALEAAAAKDRELEVLRTRAALLEHQLQERPARQDSSPGLRALLGRCTTQRDEALGLAHAMAERLSRKGFRKAGQDLLGQVASLREHWACPHPMEDAA